MAESRISHKNQTIALHNCFWQVYHTLWNIESEDLYGTGPPLRAGIMGQLISHATEWREPSRLKMHKQTLFKKISQRLWAASISQVGQFKPGNIHSEHSMKTNFPWTSFLAKLKTQLRPYLPNKIPALKGNKGFPRLRPEQSTEVCISEHTGRLQCDRVSTADAANGTSQDMALGRLETAMKLLKVFPLWSTHELSLSSEGCLSPPVLLHQLTKQHISYTIKKFLRCELSGVEQD